MYKDKNKNQKQLPSIEVINPLSSKKEKEELEEIIKTEIDNDKAERIIEKLKESGYILGKSI